ncbi:hypothetical protein H072_6537 [Dactylellina haptotyla CBS 200.50]|uniref:carboxypeptidase C n=1 Tax=Dactylellina haptotyla (strain CBS 200.50) TaxID=1284197 RepID=S8BK20_DACHA|nr:hypothetical protein H072_6537 [Dactylellina haptotyla CBS 200.50]
MRREIILGLFFGAVARAVTLTTTATTTTTTTIPTTTSTTKIVCNADLVLRALRGNAADASSFCSSFTTAVATAGQSYPSYLTSWRTTVARISSACTCLSVSPVAVTTTTTTTASTLSTTGRCDHDNCLRAVIASAFPTRSGRDDCAYFLAITVTPEPSTVTVTVATVTIETTVFGQPARRFRRVATSTAITTTTTTAASSNRIPAYASPCSGSVRYSSACSCVSALAATITAPVPLTTVTVTATQTNAFTTCIAGIGACDLSNPLGCCSGNCVKWFATPNCCVGSGVSCDVLHPEGCCGAVAALFSTLSSAYPANQRERNDNSTSRYPGNYARRSDNFWDFQLSGEASSSNLGKRGIGSSRYSLRGRAVDSSITGIGRGVKQYSGYLDDNEEDNHLFYWFFESHSNPSKDPILLWLNGGPGYSSIAAVVQGAGPTVFKNGKLQENPFSWNNHASILFLDQPVNVGFSYGSTQTDTTVAAGRDVHALLRLFFKKFPQYSELPFHIFGISYGGHWVPELSHEILSHPGNNINLQGMIIANGLTDPLTQFGSMPAMACGRGGHEAIFDQETCEDLTENIVPQCQDMIGECYKTGEREICSDAGNFCEKDILFGPAKRAHVRVYDIRTQQKRLGPRENGYGHGGDPAEDFLRSPDIMEAIGAEGHNFNGATNRRVLNMFHASGDIATPVQRYVPEVLRHIPALVYAGDKDYICNWLGVKAWTERLDWYGKRDYNKADMQSYMVGGREAGQVKSANGLTFARIYEAGHSADMDQPQPVLQLINNFMRMASGSHLRPLAPRQE